MLYYRSHDLSTLEMTTKPHDEGPGERRDGERRKVSRSELAAALAALSERVTALEQATTSLAAPTARTPGRLEIADLLSALRERLADDPSGIAGGIVVYAGVGAMADAAVDRQAARHWDDVLALDRTRASRLLAALGNPARLDIVEALVSGPLSRHQLRTRVDRASAGQLNHHLRELLAAGLLEQPRRGVYEVPPSRLVPILALLACAADLVAAVPARSGGATYTE